MDKIILSAEALVALGVTSAESPEALSAAIMKMSADLKAANDKVVGLEADAQAALETRAENLVKMAVDTGRITADLRSQYKELAIANYALAEKTLNAIPEKVSLSGKLRPIGGSSIPQGRESWTHLRWLKEDPEALSRIRANDPEAFEAIKKVR